MKEVNKEYLLEYWKWRKTIELIGFRQKRSLNSCLSHPKPLFKHHPRALNTAGAKMEWFPREIQAQRVWYNDIHTAVLS